MRKILTIIGGATVVLLAAVALALFLHAPEGRRLDASSSAYASRLLDITLRNWDLQAIKGEASEQFLAVAPDEKLTQLLRTFSDRLGTIRSHGVPRGESRLTFSNFRKVVTADYVVPVTFEKAEGQVALRFILNGDQWRLLAVNVNSEALIR